MNRPKRQKLIPYRRLMKLAVQAFNGWVRRRDSACVICGKTWKPTAGHLISARRASIRFNEIGTNRQCAPCNFKHEHYPEIYTQWFIYQYGVDAYHDLVMKSKVNKEWTRKELHQIIEAYS